jgi:hypothetical protein
VSECSRVLDDVALRNTIGVSSISPKCLYENRRSYTNEFEKIQARFYTNVQTQCTSPIRVIIESRKSPLHNRGVCSETFGEAHSGRESGDVSSSDAML